MCGPKRKVFSVRPCEDHGRADWLRYWDEFVQKQHFKKFVCLHHIKQNNLTYLGRLCTPCLSVSTVHSNKVLLRNLKLFSQSFVDAAVALKERGAYKIYVLATHGILSADAPRLIEESPINEVSDHSNNTWHFFR